MIVDDLKSMVEQILRIEIADIDKELSIKDYAREKIIKISREIIRESSNCIALIHAHGTSNTINQILGKLDKLVEKIKETARNHPDLYYSGTVGSALAEYVECKSLYYLLGKHILPTRNQLKVPTVPYLQGLADLIGELRRLTLDLLRENRVKEALILLDTMEIVYHKLKTLHYPDALTPGLRHKTDVARRLIEDTKALVIDIANRVKLEQTINQLLLSKETIKNAEQ